MDHTPTSTGAPIPAPAKKGLSIGCIVAVIFVPIAIMAVLAALAAPAGNILIVKARVLQVRAASQGLIIAVKGFQTEYNRLPFPEDQVVSESTPLISSGPWLDALLAENKKINPRGIKFYDPRIAKNRANGLVEKEGNRTLLDPWGHPYSLLLDVDGDGKIPDPEHPGALLDTSVGVFSSGPDGNPAKWQDNVKSWDK